MDFEDYIEEGVESYEDYLIVRGKIKSIDIKNNFIVIDTKEIGTIETGMQRLVSFPKKLKVGAFCIVFYYFEIPSESELYFFDDISKTELNFFLEEVNLHYFAIKELRTYLLENFMGVWLNAKLRKSKKTNHILAETFDLEVQLFDKRLPITGLFSSSSNVEYDYKSKVVPKFRRSEIIQVFVEYVETGTKMNIVTTKFRKIK